MTTQRRDVHCERCGTLKRDVTTKWARWEAQQHEARHKADEGNVPIVYVVRVGQVLYHDAAGLHPCWPA